MKKLVYAAYSHGIKFPEPQEKSPCVIQRIDGSIPGNHFDVPYILVYEKQGNHTDRESQPE
jgi:hypothetical protein